MFHFGFNVSKCQVQVQLCLGRIKLQRNKKTITIKQQRKEVAELLKTGKQESARIRVEGVIRENLMMQAFEILELYMELLNVRVKLIDKTKEIPRDMIEAISSVIYAAQRVADLPELSALRSMFASKYGKEYAAEASNDVTCAKWQVNDNLRKCLIVEPPLPEDKLATLSDIAQEHGVEWDMAAAARDLAIMPPGAGMADPTIMGGPSYPGGGPSIGGPSYPGGGAGASYPGMGYPGQAPPGVMPVMPMGNQTPQFKDAHQAAAYADQAAQQAKAAADYAAQFAMAQHGVPVPLDAPPQTAWISPKGTLQPPPDLPTAVPPPMGPVDGWGIPAGSSSEPASQNQAMVGGYVVKTNEELQRAYDEALGPPVKSKPDDQSSSSPPSAPAPPPSAPAPPPPPTGGGADDFEDLTKRLEALKKS